MTMREKYASEVIFMKDTPTSELWGVFCEDLGENWQRYKGTALYDRPIGHLQVSVIDKDISYVTFLTIRPKYYQFYILP